MAEQSARLEVLDRLVVPDLWPEVTRRRDRSSSPRAPSPLRRAVVAAFALLVAALSVFALVRVWPGRGPQPAVSPTPNVVPRVGNGSIYFRSQVRSVPTAWLDVSPNGGGLHTVFPASGSFVPDHIAFSPNGAQIAVNLLGHSGIWVANADGDHAVQLTQGANDTSPAWSPDGTKIAFVGSTTSTPCPSDLFKYGFCGRDLYVMNADGTGVRLIAENAAAPSWSPDGNHIAYATTGRAGGSIGVVNIDDRSQHILASRSEGGNRSPAWSPDGSTIVYASIRSENWGIFAVPATGGTERILRPARPATGYVDDPTWSPDGSLIAFVTGDGVSVMRPDGSHVRSIFRQQSRYPAGAIAWRPASVPNAFAGGQFAVTALDQEYNADVYLVSGTGNHMRRLTENGVSGSPAWAPDGRAIAFTVGTGEGSGELVVGRLTDRRWRVLTSRNDPQGVSWSTRGLVFSTTYGNLFFVHADGTDLHELTSSGAPCNDELPAWSPDATRLAFGYACIPGAPPPMKPGLYVANADGSLARLVFGTAVGGDLQGLSWSPEGARLAFAGARRPGIQVIGTDGTGLVRLTSGNDSSPVWSADGTQIAFVRRGQIWTVSAMGGRARQLMHHSRLRVIEVDWSPLG